MKVVYVYDEFTKEFLREHVCQNNPKESGYLLPMFYLEKKPDMSRPETPYIKNGDWVYKPKIKTVYEYDVLTKKYIGEKKLTYDVVSDGYNIPSNCVEMEPVDKVYSIWNTSTKVWDIDTTNKIKDKWSAVRQKRNSLLYECDFIINSDVPCTNACRDAYIAYRQALRDVPTAASPDVVVWPVKPQYVKK